MMALLVRVEFSSGEGEFLPVPVDYVWKLMFLHEQSSDLTLYSQRQRIGSFHLQPRRLPTGTDGTGGPIRLLSGTGSLSLSLPGIDPQNVVLRGSLELDDKNTVERFELNSGFRRAKQTIPSLNFVLDGQPARDQWHYQLRRGDTIIEENSGASAMLLEDLNLRQFGIDPKSIIQAHQQTVSGAGTTARRGVLHTNGEDIDAYVVTSYHGDLLETTVYVSQLGQILAVKTVGGYDLYDEALSP